MTSFPTFLDALEAAQVLGYTHVEQLADREPDDELGHIALADYIDYQSWPKGINPALTHAQIEEGVGGIGTPSTYRLEQDILHIDDAPYLRLTREGA